MIRKQICRARPIGKKDAAVMDTQKETLAGMIAGVFELGQAPRGPSPYIVLGCTAAGLYGRMIGGCITDKVRKSENISTDIFDICAKKYTFLDLSWAMCYIEVDTKEIGKDGFMKRKLMEEFLAWKRQPGRMPLLLYGARQVGKTYLLKEFAASCYKNYVYANFDVDSDLIPYFEGSISPERIVRVLEAYYHTRIIPEETLIIFDEIQQCERALSCLKYFCEDAPEYHVAAAGSLLGVAINRNQYAFPVGKVYMKTMYPMDFEEFLWALGEQLLADEIRDCFLHDTAMAGPLHEKALRLYDQYLIIGGMPAVVAAYRTPGSIEPQVLQNMILSAYISDMAKYCSNNQSVKNMETFESIPMQLAKNNQKFMLKHIKSGARASTHGDSIEWLAMSGLALKCYRCTRPVLPLDINREAGCFKLYMSDAGLLSAKLHMDLQKLASRDSISSNYLGAMTENYVAAQLIACLLYTSNRSVHNLVCENKGLLTERLAC